MKRNRYPRGEGLPPSRLKTTGKGAQKSRNSDEISVEKEAKAKKQKDGFGRRSIRFLLRHKMLSGSFLLLLFFFAVCFCARFCIWYFTVETNTDPVYSTAELEARLSDYRDLKEFLDENSLEEITYIIPGLKSTRSLCANHAGEPSVCHSMTPQGVCVTEDYVLISAYCHHKRHNSVIYVMSRVTHEYIKEIVLPGRPHVGSIAYDTVHHNIWVACSSDDTAYVNCFSLDDLEMYFFDDGYQTMKYRQKTPLTMITKASFLYYQDECLYVGYFSVRDHNQCTLQRYRIGMDGALVMTDIPIGTDLSTGDTLLSGSALPYETAPISAQCQGVALYGDYLFLSQSYSMKKSKLQVIRRSEGGGVLDATNDNALLTLTLPPMLEQIYVDGDEMYLMFESAGSAYRWRVGTRVDRVLRVRVDQIAALLQK